MLQSSASVPQKLLWLKCRLSTVPQVAGLPLTLAGQGATEGEDVPAGLVVARALTVGDAFADCEDWALAAADALAGAPVGRLWSEVLVQPASRAVARAAAAAITICLRTIASQKRKR
jgi:hypothetical protein